jgi:ABC-2 type transport system ATP-binding protein
MSPDIEVRNLTLRYSETLAIDDLSVRLTGGKIYGLLGRNGSGKTSLLTVLAAFRQPSSGTVLIAGEPPFENQRITEQICLIRDEIDTYGTTTVSKALAFAASFRPYWDEEYAIHLAEKFKLPMKKRISALSRGMKSALSITLGLASRAPLTIFDESYLGMDAPARYTFYEELLADYLAHPRTIILSTHLIEELGSLFEEILIIDRGRLLLHEETDTLRAKGVTVTGPAETVDRFIATVGAGLTVLGEQQLGGTKSTTAYGQLDPVDRERARVDGLDLGPVPVQDLFVHLTRDEAGKNNLTTDKEPLR